MVVVGSGMTGLETAEILNETGNRVTVIEMAKEIAPGTWFQLLDDEMERLQPAGTRFLTGHQLIGDREGEIVSADLQGGQDRPYPGGQRWCCPWACKAGERTG